jgi:hypothetical protein
MWQACPANGAVRTTRLFELLSGKLQLDDNCPQSPMCVQGYIFVVQNLRFPLHDHPFSIANSFARA